MNTLRVGGITPLTSLDFPGKLAAVVFCQGCPWRCGYCHNPHLLEAKVPVGQTWPSVLDFLERRRGLLSGVVFSGGEPTLQAGLAEAMQQVRDMGFKVALHTAGMYPWRLATLLPLIDWVGFDVKAPWSLYDTITGTPGSGRRARSSLDHLVASGVPFECRTTWHAGLFSEAELLSLGTMLADLGVHQWMVQDCRLPGQTRLHPASLNRSALSQRIQGLQRPGFKLRDDDAGAIRLPPSMLNPS